MASSSDSAAARNLASSAEKVKAEAAGIGSDLADKAGDIAAAANEALAEMRRVIDDFAAKTGAATSDAAGSVKAAGVEAGRQVSSALNSAEALGREGIDTIADTVARRPLTSVAIAAGIGLVLGYCSRESARK